jgi:putative phage-type endonuclease
MPPKLHPVKLQVKRLPHHQLQQGSEKWKKARKEYPLTSSEFGAALGVGRFKSRIQLWKEKTGRSKAEESDVQKTIFQYGKDMEPLARSFMQTRLQEIYDDTSIQIEETGLFKLERGKDAMTYAASPDGVIKATQQLPPITVEIKCPYQKKIYSYLLDYPKEEGVRLDLDHYIQVQAQMRAVGTCTAYFICWTEEEHILIHVQRNDAFMDHVLNELDYYVDNYLHQDKEPPRLTTKKLVQKKLYSLIPPQSMKVISQTLLLKDVD